MNPKKWVIVKFLSKKSKLHKQMRAVPEPWLTPKPATDSTNTSGETQQSCRLPRFTIEFELSTKVSRYAKVKSSWKEEDVQIITDAVNYNEAKIKEGFGGLYSTKEEIEDAYAKKIASEGDKRKRHSRHTKKLSDSDGTSNKRKRVITETSSESSSDSDSNDDHEKDHEMYPQVPENKLFLAPAKKQSAEQDDMTSSTNFTVSPKRRKSDDPTFDDFEGVNIVDQTPNSPFPRIDDDDTTKVDRQKDDYDSVFENGTPRSPPYPNGEDELESCLAGTSDNDARDGDSTEDESDVEHHQLKKKSTLEKNALPKRNERSVAQSNSTSKANLSSENYECEVEECNQHKKKYLNAFVIGKLENGDIVAAPYIWLSLDSKYMYWPPGKESHVLKNYILNKVVPATTWGKFAIVETYEVADDYEHAVKVLNVARNSENNFAGRKKVPPRKTEEVVILPRNSRSSNTLKVSESDVDQLSDRDLMKVILNNVQEVEAKQNKILGSIENQPNNQIIGSTTLESKIDEVYKDIPCESAPDLQKLEKKIASDKKYVEALKAYMQSLSNKGGHDLMQKMISAAMTNALQNKFSMEGKRKKIAFDKLLLWPVLRDAAVTKYRKNYAETDAKKTAGDWIKTAKRRMGRAKTNRKTLQDLLNMEAEDIS